MNKKRWDRCSIESLERGETDARGRTFLTVNGPIDLSGVEVLHAGVDTLRQLYSGVPAAALVEEIGDYYRRDWQPVMPFLGREWVVGSGGKSGYRFRLQNNEHGLIIFYGSRYKHLEREGAHLKIECAPHFLKDNPPEKVQAVLDEIAEVLLRDPKPSGVAVHIAIDVQGWEPPRDFEERLTTRSKRRAFHNELDKVELIGGETVQRYGRQESYLFGSPGGVQFSMYRKEREALKRDKLDWWESVWRNRCNDDLEPVYDPAKPVWRLEWRFHHNVVRDIQEESGKGFRRYTDVAPVLTNILHYGMDLFRLDHSGSYVDPFWQLLYEDVQVLGEHETFVVRRVHKTLARGNEKNLALAFGNMMSLYARYHYTPRQVIKHLKGAGLWKELCVYWSARGYDPQRVVERALLLRHYVGRAA